VAIRAVIATVGSASWADWMVAGTVALALTLWFVRSGFRALVVYALIVLFGDTLVPLIGPGAKLIDEVGLLALAIATLLTRRRALAGALHVVRDGGFVLYLAAGLASSVFERVETNVWPLGLALVAKGPLLFYIALSTRPSVEDVRWTRRIVVLVGVLVLAAGVTQVVFPAATALVGLESRPSRAGLPSASSLFYHPQLFGWFCGYIALLMYSWYASTDDRRNLLAALAFSIGVMLSARRRAIIATLVGFVAGVLVARPRGSARAGARTNQTWRRAALGLGAIILVFLPALAGLMLLTLETTLGTGTPARVALYAGAVQIAADKLPLGAGFGRYGSWMSRQEYSSVYDEYGLSGVYGLSRDNPQFITDTFWPQVLGETGLLGLLGYVAFLAGLGRQLMRLAVDARGPVLVVALQTAMVMVFAQSLVESLASPIFNSPPQVVPLMLGFATAIGIRGR
jgi:hypothetical protein